MVFHHIFKADDPIEVAYNEIIILVVFDRIIPGITSTPLESLFDLTLKDTSLSRIFPEENKLNTTLLRAYQQLSKKAIVIGFSIY